jgi:hypothetical protein
MDLTISTANAHTPAQMHTANQKCTPPKSNRLTVGKRGVHCIICGGISQNALARICCFLGIHCLQNEWGFEPREGARRP